MKKQEQEPVFDRTEAPAPFPVAEKEEESDVTSGVGELPSARRTRSRAYSTTSTRTGSTLRRQRSEYEGNPYDIDRVNTRQSDFSLK